jgi:uncharacterized membrane protein
MESNGRSLAKAISYRLLGSIGTALIFYMLTGKAGLSVGAGGLDIVLKLALYFVHERIWNSIAFGRPKSLTSPEYEI